MENILKLYEDIKTTVATLNVGEKEWFNYVSKTSIHSEVTDWAYGKALERRCVDLSAREINGKLLINDKNARNYFKVIACMPNWIDLITDLTVTINGKVVYDNKETFFEQVNLGWPALYIQLPCDALNNGENDFSIKTSGKLFLSEISIVSYPQIKDFSQVSLRKFVKQGEYFGVAVCDKTNSFCAIKEIKNCQFDKAERYEDLTVLSFFAKEQGKSECVINIGGKELSLQMPTIVENVDDFLFGSDSDDHRHDNSDETAFIIENLIMSDMGNFIQLRPQYSRNHYKLLSEQGFKKLIDLASLFGIKYGVCDCAMIAPYLSDLNSETFYGYHIHEPYLFFNPALLENPYEKEKYFCEPEKINSSNSFGESRKLYQEVLNKSRKAFSKDKGLTSLGAPSMLCIYEGESGVDRITIEPVSNLNLLVGAVRTTSVKTWGAHVPTDWYFGVPVDVVKSNKYRLAMQYLYLNGAKYLYAENSLFKTNAFERCDWESEFCTVNRKYHREFYEYALTHQRKGKLLVDKAFIYGRNEFFMWKLNDRIAELKEKDWDSNVWGKWNNDYQIAWNATEEWLPPSDKQNVFESPLNKNLFSGTPYGNVDIVSADGDFSKYKQLSLLGWNTMDEDLLSKLKDFVQNGGELMISYAHFNQVDRNDLPFEFVDGEKIKDFIGVDIKGAEKIAKNISFVDGKEFRIEQDLEIAVGNVLGAKVLCSDQNGKGVVYLNNYGKGKVYFTAFKDYPCRENDIEVYKYVLKLMGENSLSQCNNNNVSFTIRETQDNYYIHALNMNCLENASEEFTIKFNGKELSATIAVGEIKEFIIDKD